MHSSDRRSVVFIGGAWLLLALALFLVMNPGWFGLSLSAVDNGWVSAHQMTIARAYAIEGFVRLHGIPLQNNGLLDGRPDVYLHWPQLFAALLSRLFLVFGSREVVAFWTMTAVNCGIAALLLLIGCLLAGIEAGIFAAFAWFTLPVTVAFGYMVHSLTFAVLPTLLAILCLLNYLQNVGPPRMNLIVGCISVAVAVLSTWEPALMTVGVWLMARFDGTRRLFWPATAYAATAIATVLAILAWYGICYPEAVREVFATILHRAGLASYQVAKPDLYEMFQIALYRQAEVHPSLRFTLIEFIDRLRMLGMLGIIALAGLWLEILWGTRRDSDLAARAAIVGLTAFWLLWVVVMRQHYFQHSSEMLLAAPVAALAIGLFIQRFLDHIRKWSPGPQQRIALLIVLLAVPGAMALELSHRVRLRLTRADGSEASAQVEYGRAIRDHTKTDDVVLSPSPSMVPVYYSERHMVRGIASDELLRRTLPEIEARSGTRAIYLALEPNRDQAFHSITQRFAPVFENHHLVLFMLKQPGTP